MTNQRPVDDVRHSASTERESLLSQLQIALPSLSPARNRIAAAVLSDPGAAGRSTITTLASRADADPATITRFVSALGYDGYQHFRSAVARDAGRDEFAGWARDLSSNISPTDTADTVLNVLARHRVRAIRSTLESLADAAEIERVADRVACAVRVYVYGEWGDGIVARELHLRLIRAGVSSWHLEGDASPGVFAASASVDDVAIAISRTGAERGLRQFFDDMSSKDVPTVVLTGAPESPAGQAADTVIFTGTGVGPNWTDYVAGRESDSLAASLLWVMVMQRRHNMPKLHESS